jgi:hypothetical protein
MHTVRVAAVQASYVLMNRDATIERVAALTAAAAREGARGGGAAGPGRSHPPGRPPAARAV